MSANQDPVNPNPPEKTEEYDVFLNDYWEALQLGEAIDPQQWTSAHPECRDRLEELRLVLTLHDALKMVGEDSRIGPHLGPEETTTTGSGPLTPASKPEETAKVVGGYRCLRQLGGGGMGEVFEAENCMTGQRVALKLIAPHFDASDANVERFRREGRLASSIIHPRCVFVLAADEDAGQPYIVMELMPGDTLKDLVERQGPLPPEEAVRKILDVVAGLREAHRRQVLHRDVKPSNCFLEADGRVKIGDFGLSRSLSGDASLTQVGTFVGTIQYAAPEQFKGPGATDLRSDVYGVAATLYYLLTGQPPFADLDAAAVVARKASEPAPPLRRLRPDIPAALEEVVLRGLERDPNRRWPDLGEFRRALLTSNQVEWKIIRSDCFIVEVTRPVPGGGKQTDTYDSFDLVERTKDENWADIPPFQLLLLYELQTETYDDLVERTKDESWADIPPFVVGLMFLLSGWVYLAIGMVPSLWIVWSLLFRGGLSLRLMGLALVRSSGRKALRVQCAWRALLMWAPVTALLLASAWLDCLSWSKEVWDQPAYWELAWLALATWWLALALLAAYFILAFRRPTRSLHDRLAGTYLVPK